MTAHSEHPSDILLQAYVQGRLPLADASSLDAHIEKCDACGQKLAEIGADTFSDLLRATTDVVPVFTIVDPELPAELQNHSRYEIQERLGRGGMGVVWRAVHRMMHRPVALKLIRPELLASPEAVERFRREVRAAAKLAHPNIVTAYDAEEVGGVHFLVMEYVDGKTLDAIVKKRGPLPVAIACHLARQVALGLDHAHSHGMVHRDIKPLNLILADKSKVKILDFGLALWHTGDGLEPGTREGQALGTLLYAAPEQRTSAGRVDARADQYSLGATLAFLLTGQPPSRNREWPEEIPEGLQIILSRLMAKSPEERYSSVKDVAEALAPWCSRKPPTLEPTAKRWNFRIALGALLAGLMIVLALVVVSSMRDRTPKVDPVPVVQPPKPWRSLLSFDPALQQANGWWQRIDGELTVAATQGACIAIPGTVPAEYDLRIVFTRKTGKNSVGAVILQNGQQVTFEVDAWNMYLGGFQNVDGFNIKENSTRCENVGLENGRRYTMLIEVRHDAIRGSLDGREIARHSTDGRDLTLDPNYWKLPTATTLGLVAWDSATTFHSVEIAAP